MRKLLVLLVALLAVSAAPAQAAPSGFRESSRLTPRMRAISGNPQAVVYCARSAEAFNAKVREVLSAGVRAEAFTVYAENAAYFQAYTCNALERWLRGKPATRYEVGVMAHALAHEAVHLGGTIDEKAAECGSLASLAVTLRAHFAVKNPAAVKAMVAAAHSRNRLKGPTYRC